MTTRARSVVSRNCEPVTVVAAPRKRSFMAGPSAVECASALHHAPSYAPAEARSTLSDVGGPCPDRRRSIVRQMSATQREMQYHARSRAPRCRARSARHEPHGGSEPYETTHRRHHPAALLSWLAAVANLWRVGVYMGWFEFEIFGDKGVQLQDANWGAALWALLIAAIWFWVAVQFWNVRAAAGSSACSSACSR